MSEYLPGTLIAVSKDHLKNTDQILDPMFLMEGMQLRQVTQLLGIEAHTVQNWVKRGFVDPPVKKLYNRDRFVRLAILNYFKDVFSLEAILSVRSRRRSFSIYFWATFECIQNTSGSSPPVAPASRSVQ